MSKVVGSVIAASASAVAKVFVIGAVGYISVKYPKGNPYLPTTLVGPVSRFAFNLMNVALIYSLTGATVSTDTLVELWFVPVAAFFVFFLSFATATVLSFIPCFRVEKRVDFEVLRIVATFPNIVAFSILIFPSLCEYDVVYEAFSSLERNSSSSSSDTTTPTALAMQQDCSDQANTMVFTYYFTWNLLFWCLGYQKILSAAKRQEQLQQSKGERTMCTVEEPDTEEGAYTQQQQQEPQSQLHNVAETPNQRQRKKSSSSSPSTRFLLFQRLKTNDLCRGIWITVSGSSFVAMALGFFTACVPPLQSALFSPGGALRFLGAATESIAGAFPPIATIVVAASLVASDDEDARNQNAASSTTTTTTTMTCDSLTDGTVETTPTPNTQQQEQNPVGGCPADHGHSRFKCCPLSTTNKTTLLSYILQNHSSSTIRMHLWFNMSRLVVTPAIVCGLLLALDCHGYLRDVKPVAKMVVMLNSALPGALMMVVVLKSHNFAYSASVVARVYLPSYLIAILTVGSWSSVGLWMFIPTKDNGMGGGDNGFCRGAY